MFIKSTFIFSLIITCNYFANAVSGDIMIADFEGQSYGQGWVITGTAFGDSPATGTIGTQQTVSGFEGYGLVNTYLPNDKSVGTLTSPEFTIQRNYIRFLIGGGSHPDQTCINLLVNGIVVRTETGFNEERLRDSHWDVEQLIGQQAKIQIVDNYTSQWGHINIDSIHQSDTPAYYDMQIVVDAQKRYLNIPVDNEQDEEKVYLYVDGQMDYYLDLRLANPGEADFWVYMDITRYNGRQFILETRRDSSYDPDSLSQCYQSTFPRGYDSYYKEKLRPRYHYTSRRGRLNDANGLVYYNGDYHLFYQHNPYGWLWGNMHWGHAVSKDLVHWKELGDAIFPDELGTIYSGSAVVDTNNTTGFKTGEYDPIVTIYTSAGDHAPVATLRTQSICYSNDNGRTFKKYDDNPVVEHIIGTNRDPKVIWHQQSGKWIMALYLTGNTYGLLSSPDLKTWQQICSLEIDGVTECPDFFPIELDGDSRNVKWIFWGGNSTYVVGTFDGTTFTPQTPPRKCYNGGNAYAGQTFNNIPESDGRVLHIAWQRSNGREFVGMPFNQQMAFPVELTLHTTPQGPMLYAWPVDEIQNLYTRSITDITSEHVCINTDLLDIYAEFDITGSSGIIGFDIRGKEFIYNISTRQITANGYIASLEPVDGKVNMRILTDVVSVEFFAGDGIVYIPSYLYDSEQDGSIKVFSNALSGTLSKFEINELSSIWK